MKTIGSTETGVIVELSKEEYTALRKARYLVTHESSKDGNTDDLSVVFEAVEDLAETDLLLRKLATRLWSIKERDSG